MEYAYGMNLDALHIVCQISVGTVLAYGMGYAYGIGYAC